MIADSKSAIPPKVCGLGLQARLIPRTTSCAVTGRGGLVFHITPPRMVTVCFRPLSVITGRPAARSGVGVRVSPGIAGQLAADAASAAERARVSLVRFDHAYFLHGRETDSRLLDDADGAIADPSCRDKLLSRRFFVMGSSRGPRAPVQAGQAWLRRPGSGPLTAAHAAVSYGLVRLGRLDDAIELLSPILGLSSSTATMPTAGQPWDEWAPYGVVIYALVYAGRLGEAEELLTRAWELVVDQPTAEIRSYVAGWLAALHLEQGRVASAFRRATESYTLSQQLGRAVHSRPSGSVAAQALALTGQAGPAAETLAAMDALGLPANLLHQTDLLQARAWAAAAAGDLPGARDQLEAAAGLGEEIGDLIGATSALHGLARLGRGRHVAARLAALAGEVGGDLVAARAAYANALADRDGEALAKVSGDFEVLGANLYAAEARAEAAVLLRRAGRARSAAAMEQKAGRLLACCEGAVTPAVQAITARVLLTPGELDAARQAAAGRSSRQIAADMHLSVRTVESRLQRVYEKLGVCGRRELVGALADRAGRLTAGHHRDLARRTTRSARHRPGWSCPTLMAGARLVR